MPLSGEAVKIVNAVEGKLHRHYGKDLKSAKKAHIFRALSLTLRDIMAESRIKTKHKVESKDGRQVHYLSMEFLLGRSLQKNAFNLGMTKAIEEACPVLGLTTDELFETEPDAGLGNGGLGRLAACYLDSLTTLGIPATGYSICYHFGIFKQKIVDGGQAELPDPWMDIGDVWLTPNMDRAKTVRFGGKLIERQENGRDIYEVEGETEVLAIPMDMNISGYGTEHTNVLRLWDAKSPTAIDMSLFSQGEYLKAIEQTATAEVIAKVLYPDDNHFEGKLLRLRQQYFFVSATVQDIVSRHLERYGTLTNFHLKHVLHINDTHPTLVIPELMRIFIDEGNMEWESAWQIVTHSVAYTNHTILSEALETWNQQFVEMLLPRIWKILCEINDRYINMLRSILHDEYRVSQMAVIWDGQVRMARLCAMACYAVNGVSELHSNILRESVFKEEFALWPNKFYNVTNGVDHRRWLAQINPRLHSLITDLLGSDSYLTQPKNLLRLEAFAEEPAALEKLMKVKYQNKLDMARYVKDTAGIIIDPNSIFDMQVKRLHEYKRQLLNILNILTLYHKLKDDKTVPVHPRTFFFGAKAAPGYYIAKRIIRLIHSVANEINNDPDINDLIKVVFLENYRVSVAERLMPSAEVSEQISLAGKEASGTGNMKLMLNGAITIGTMDGANVEISHFVGDDNVVIFGLRAHEAEELWKSGYTSSVYYNQDENLKRALDHISSGFSDGQSYEDIVSSLLVGHNGTADTYMVLADYGSYAEAQAKVESLYRDKERFNGISLRNIAASGHFAADRSVSQYSRHIWGVL